MKFINCTEASAQMGITVRRVQQMCKNGNIPGVVKQGRTWLVPDSAIHNVTNKETDYRKKKKPLPIGIADFKEAS